VFFELRVRSVISMYGDNDGDNVVTSRNGSVGIVSKLCWMSEQSWFDSRQDKETFPVSRVPKPLLETTGFLFSGYLGPFPGVKAAEACSRQITLI
jgi:hypothetical protein